MSSMSYRVTARSVFVSSMRQSDQRTDTARGIPERGVMTSYNQTIGKLQ